MCVRGAAPKPPPPFARKGGAAGGAATCDGAVCGRRWAGAARVRQALGSPCARAAGAVARACRRATGAQHLRTCDLSHGRAPCRARAVRAPRSPCARVRTHTARPPPAAGGGCPAPPPFPSPDAAPVDWGPPGASGRAQTDPHPGEAPPRAGRRAGPRTPRAGPDGRADPPRRPSRRTPTLRVGGGRRRLSRRRSESPPSPACERAHHRRPARRAERGLTTAGRPGGRAAAGRPRVWPARSRPDDAPSAPPGGASDRRLPAAARAAAVALPNRAHALRATYGYPFPSHTHTHGPYAARCAAALPGDALGPTDASRCGNGRPRSGPQLPRKLRAIIL